jgi:hypothetical protein
VLGGQHGAGPAQAAHHLVGDEQGAELVAQRAQPLQVTGRRHGRAQRRATDRLDDDAGQGVAVLDEAGPGRVEQVPRVLVLVHPVGVAVRVGGRQHGERSRVGAHDGAPGVTGQRQAAEGVAVVAPVVRQEPLTLGLADLLEVLQRELQGGLDRLGAAVDEPDAVRPGPGGQPRRELFERLAGERGAVHIRHPPGLFPHGRHHVRVAVSDRGHRGAGRAVDVAAAGGVDQPHPVGVLDAGQVDADDVLDQGHEHPLYG